MRKAYLISIFIIVVSFVFGSCSACFFGGGMVAEAKSNTQENFAECLDQSIHPVADVLVSEIQAVADDSSCLSVSQSPVIRKNDQPDKLTLASEVFSYLQSDTSPRLAKARGYVERLPVDTGKQDIAWYTGIILKLE